jgi:hypothetical protein
MYVCTHSGSEDSGQQFGHAVVNKRKERTKEHYALWFQVNARGQETSYQQNSHTFKARRRHQT